MQSRLARGQEGHAPRELGHPSLRVRDRGPVQRDLCRQTVQVPLEVAQLGGTSPDALLRLAQVVLRVVQGLIGVRRHRPPREERHREEDGHDRRSGPEQGTEGRHEHETVHTVGRRRYVRMA